MKTATKKSTTSGFAVDVARTKKLKIFDIATGKMHTIQPQAEKVVAFIEKADKSYPWYMEEGGGFDLLKLLLLDRQHTVYTIPGIRVKEYRDSLGLKKEQGETDDETSAKLIAQLAQKKPELFYRYETGDILVTEISLWCRTRHVVEKQMVAQKLRRSAAKDILEFYSERMPDAKKILSLVDVEIENSQRLFNSLKGVISKKVEQHILWEKALKNVKGVGPIIAGDLIARIRRPGRFENGRGRAKYKLRKLAGMIEKKGNQKFDHGLKRALFHFAESQVRAVGSPWNVKLKKFKEEYKVKHPDWTKGNIHNKGMKKIETKFLDWVFGVWRNLENNGG